MGGRAYVQSRVARLLFPQGKAPLVQVPVRTMPCPPARRVWRLVGWGKLAVEEPRSADHERFVQALCRIEPWWVRFAASRGSFPCSSGL